MAAPHTRWTGHGASTDWSDPANWSKSGVPATGIDALFTDGGTWTVALAPKSAPSQAGALIVQGDTLTLASGGLALAPVQATKGNTFDLTLSQGAFLTVGARAQLVGTNVAQIGVAGSAATLNVAGLVREEYGIVSGGTLNILAGGHWWGGSSGVEIGANGTLTVQAGGRLDAGPGTLQVDTAILYVGDPTGTGSVTVSGADAVVRASDVILGSNEGDATLTIADGGQVIDGGGQMGQGADVTATVTGAGSLWENTRGLSVGGLVPVNSSLTITDHGTVGFGQYGLQLEAKLALDGSATLDGRAIVSGGGQFLALAGAGNVTIGQTIQLLYNPFDPFDSLVNYFSAQPGTELILDGRISGLSNAVLDATSGHIVLANANNSYAATDIYAATLEIAATGAAGHGALSFASPTQPGELLIDAGIHVANTIDGFGHANTIDLAGLNFADDLTKTWTQNSGSGTLTIGTPHHDITLNFAGSYTAANFTLAIDPTGGTLVGHI